MIIRNYHLTQSHDWSLLIGKGALGVLPRHISFRDYSSIVIATDDNVAPCWLSMVIKSFGKSGSVLPIIIPHGERSKCMQTVESILASLQSVGMGRDGLLIALGGGVVGDVTGFAASIYKRGIDYIQIPTSLIALTDSAIGGKTGIDFVESKNSVGTFYQPRLVVCDPMFLKTLPRRELVNGMAEVIKYGLITDEKFLGLLTSHTLDDMPWERVIDFCATYKADIVARDERDTLGLRALVNFGHTVGHAIEALSRYRVPHGHGVAIGMMVAARMSSQVLGLSEFEREKIEFVLHQFGLPTRLPKGMNVNAIIQKLGTDKKARAGKVKWVLLKKIGKAVPGIEVPGKVVKKALECLYD